jgi:type I restriction enzyme, S subunit
MTETDLPKGWSMVRLGSVAFVQTGLAKGKQGVKDSLTLPYLRVANVQDGFLDLADIKEIQVERTEVERYRLKKGDVLLTEGGDNDKLGRGDVWQGQIPMCLHQNHIFAVRTQREVLDPHFLSALAGSSYGKLYFRRCSKQSTNLATINSTQLKEFPVILPPKHEQLAIVRCLRTWDEAITLTERRIAAEQQLRLGFMQQLLTGQVRFPEFAQHPWIETRIGDVLQNVTRLLPLEDDQLYRQAIVRRWSAGIEYRESLYGHQIKGKALQQIREGDFLISNIQAAYGAMSKVGKDSEGAWISNIYTILVPRHDRSVDIDYFNFLSQTPMMRHLVIASCNGFKAERIRLGFVVPTFLKQQISIPARYEEQRRIAEVLAACDRELDLLVRKRDALQRQKRGLMQQLLTGRVRVKV